MKILSLFDGMSVAQQALKNIGADVEVYYASEIDEYAKAVTQSNFPKTDQLGSVVDLYPHEPDKVIFREMIDLLIGGSPCQDLSIAKKNREGLKGERSGLFYEYVRIRDEVKPKYFILENVASMPKEAKEQISEILGVEPIMINASLVSAQNRKRLFWVGKWNGEKYEQVEISQPEDRGILLKDILEIDVDEKFYVYNQYNDRTMTDKCGTLGTCMGRTAKQGYQVIKMRDKSLCIDANYYKGTSVEHYKEKSTRQLVPQRKDGIIMEQVQDTVKVRKHKVDVSKLKSTLREHKNLTNKEIAKQLKQPITKVEHWFRNDTSFSIPDEDVWFQLKELLNIKTDEFDKSITEFEIRDGKFDMSKRVYSQEGKSPTITTISGGQQHKIVKDDYQIRKLTPTECLRLQSMPDDYFDKAEYKGKPISNTQRYKMCGNAFNCAVIEHILKQLI